MFKSPGQTKKQDSTLKNPIFGSIWQSQNNASQFGSNVFGNPKPDLDSLITRISSLQLAMESTKQQNQKLKKQFQEYKKQHPTRQQFDHLKKTIESYNKSNLNSNFSNQQQILYILNTLKASQSSSDSRINEILTMMKDLKAEFSIQSKSIKSVQQTITSKVSKIQTTIQGISYTQSNANNSHKDPRVSSSNNQQASNYNKDKRNEQNAKSMTRYQGNYKIDTKICQNQYQKLIISNEFGKIQNLSPLSLKLYLNSPLFSKPITQYVRIQENKCEILAPQWEQYPFKLTTYNFMNMKQMNPFQKLQLNSKIKEQSEKAGLKYNLSLTECYLQIFTSQN